MSEPATPPPNRPRIDSPSVLRPRLPHERALAKTLAIASRQRRDPADLIQLLSFEFRRRAGRRLRKVASLIAAGHPVLTALERVPGSLEPKAILALRLAERRGEVLPMLDSLTANSASEEPAIAPAAADASGHHLRQAVIGVCVAWLIFSFMMTFLVPTFEKMFGEFGLRLPEPMRLMILVSRFGGELFLLTLILIAGLLWLGYRLSGNRSWLWSRRRSRITRSDTLALFSLIIQSRIPWDEGLTVLADHHPSGRTRKRFRECLRAMDQGDEVWQSLKRQRFIDHGELRALQSVAPESGSRPTDPRRSEPGSEFEPDETGRQTQLWLLDRRAIVRRDRQASGESLLLRGVSMIAMLILAVVVLWFSVAVFMTLYGLVESLT